MSTCPSWAYSYECHYEHDGCGSIHYDECKKSGYCAMPDIYGRWVNDILVGKKVPYNHTVVQPGIGEEMCGEFEHLNATKTAQWLAENMVPNCTSWSCETEGSICLDGSPGTNNKGSYICSPDANGDLKWGGEDEEPISMAVLTPPVPKTQCSWLPCTNGWVGLKDEWHYQTKLGASNPAVPDSYKEAFPDEKWAIVCSDILA